MDTNGIEAVHGGRIEFPSYSRSSMKKLMLLYVYLF
jgi:hypothetical protein